MNEVALEGARRALETLLEPIEWRLESKGVPSLWVPRPDTLAGPFSDGLLESFIVEVAPSNRPAGYRQHKGGKALYFLNEEDREEFLKKAGHATRVKVGSTTHIMRVQSTERARSGLWASHSVPQMRRWKRL